MLGIDQLNLKASTFQNLKCWNPINTSGFHGNVFDSTFIKPIRHIMQISCETFKIFALDVDFDLQGRPPSALQSLYLFRLHQDL
jgi:hypothetical protein